MPRVHVWHKLSTGELKKKLNMELWTFRFATGTCMAEALNRWAKKKLNMDQHLTLNTFKKVKQIQELITEEVTELFLLLLLSLFFLLLIMSILLLLSSLLERISFHFVNVHVWRRRFSMVCIKFSMFKIVFGYYFANNAGGATIWTNIIWSTICWWFQRRRGKYEYFVFEP